MALDGTYTGLQEAVIQWLFNKTHLAPFVPDWVVLAETQLNARLRLSEMLVTAPLSVTGEVYSLPSDVAAIMSVAALSNPRRTLQMVEQNAVDIPRRAGLPSVYTRIGGDLSIWPSNNSDVEVIYYQKLPSIVTNETNWLLQEYPSIYLYATLMQAGPFVEDETMLATWGQLLDREIGALEAKDAYTRIAGSRVRTVGVNP